MAREGGQQHRTGKRADETEEAPEVEPGGEVAVDGAGTATVVELPFA